MSAVRRFADPEALTDWLIARVGPDIRVGAPLGLGKPPILMNALYRRAKSDARLRLTFITALSLDVPALHGDLERRLLAPVFARVFEDYPGLDYERDLVRQALPPNITVSEFFFRPGAMLGNRHAQRHYRSVNYTHAARELMAAGVNVLMQMVAPGTASGELSLSCNTDVTLDLLPELERRRAAGDAPLLVAQCNRRLPTMTRSALVAEDRFDALLSGPAADFKPFGPPAAPVPDTDYGIALRVSALVADRGTLQMGIGSLSDAIAYCLTLRQRQNDRYRRLLARLPASAAEAALADRIGARAPFVHGLYGCTEMLVDAYLQLYRAGVIGRRVYDDLNVQQLHNAGAIDDAVTPNTLTALLDNGIVKVRLRKRDAAYLQRIGVFHRAVTWAGGRLHAGDDKPPIVPDLADRTARGEIERRCLGRRLAAPSLVHGGFFLGPNAFYQRLHELSPTERDLFHMTGVGYINQLYGDEAIKRAQRRAARFINTALKVSLDGAVAADGLASGQVVSGVGGQYNFVAQAHALAGARSIICVRAVRESADGCESNIVVHYAYNTVPRHLRDIVVTEYGVADLRGQTDEAVAMALIEIADARFQDRLRSAAIAAGKLSRAYRIPARARGNTPAAVRGWLAAERGRRDFPPYPYGSDFTPTEQALMRALQGLKKRSGPALLMSAARHATRLGAVTAAARPYLQRMGLDAPASWRERLTARLLILALCDAGVVIRKRRSRSP